MMPTPWARSDAIVLKRTSTSRGVRAAVGSSITRTRRFGGGGEGFGDLDDLPLARRSAAASASPGKSRRAATKACRRALARCVPIDHCGERKRVAPARELAEQDIFGDGEIGGVVQFLVDHANARPLASRGERKSMRWPSSRISPASLV